MCKKECNSCLLAVILGIILGVVIGVLYYFALIPAITTAIFFAIGIAGISFLLLTIVAAFGGRNTEKCVCKQGTCVAITSIGTIIATLIALSITLATANVGIAILIGIGGGFLVANVVSLIRWILCIVEENCKSER